MVTFVSLRRILGGLVQTKPERNFNRLAYRVWPRKVSSDTGKVLVEANAGPSSVISFAYVANALAQNHQAGIRAFAASGNEPLVFPLLTYWWPRHLYWLALSSTARSYRAFGSRGLSYPRISRAVRKRAAEITKDFYASRPTKRKLERLRVGGVLVGDLFYDTYLRSRKLASVDLNSRDLQRFTKNSIAHTLFWIAQISAGKLTAIVVSHGVYNSAIPARVAMQRGIPAYQAGGGSAVALSKGKPRVGEEFRDYRKTFSALSVEAQQEGSLRARHRIERRFKGEVGVDMSYSSTSSFRGQSPLPLVSESRTPKVLVAMHCFSDAPHAVGYSLFPDFWEWLLFLGRMTFKTDYEWYLKIHPDCVEGSLGPVHELMTLFPRFRLLPALSSHLQLASEGITAVLTVYGTVGFEYALLGVPVINASPNNPHVAYDFNYHPKTVREYTALIREIPNLKTSSVKVKNQVEEYYFMRHLHRNSENFFGESLFASGFPRDVTLYDCFVETWDPREHHKLMARLAKHIDQGFRFL